MTTKTFEGMLLKLYSKSGHGKRGKWTAYSGKFADKDGNEYEDWVSFGFARPDVDEGGTYKVTCRQDGDYWKVVDSGIEVIAPPADSDADSDNDEPKKGKDVPKSGTPFRTNKTQEQISYQAARNSALAFVELAIKQDALPLGGKNKADKFKELEALVDKLTVQYAKDKETLRLFASVADGRLPAPKAAPAVLAADSDDSDEP